MTDSKSNYAWAALSGLLLTAALPKINFSFFAWFALLPLLVAVRNASPQQGLRLGFTTGMVHYIGLLYWLVHTMHIYGYLPIYQCIIILFFMATILSLFLGGFGWFIASKVQKPGQLWLVPVIWTTIEYLRAYLFTGFPWGFLGHTQYQNLWVIQIADLIGVYGISFLIATINISIFVCFTAFFKYKWKGNPVRLKIVGIFLVFAAVMLSATLFYGRYRVNMVDRTTKKAPTVNVALIQGNIDQSIKWEASFQNYTIKRYNRLSQSSLSAKPDLVVWPETAAPFYFTYDKGLTRKVIRNVRKSKTFYLVGSPSVTIDKDVVQYYNSAYLIAPTGSIIGKYDKVHLVPFGEYVPLKKWLPFIGKMVEQIGDFRPGKKGGVLSWKTANLGIQICYEIIFPDLARAMVKNGSDLLINITNDAWFGTTGAADQHFAMAVFRAVENKRALARSANTGISGFIDPAGRILMTTPLYEEKVLTQSIPVLKETTIYTRFGDIFAWICSALTALTIVTGIIKNAIKFSFRKKTPSNAA